MHLVDGVLGFGIVNFSNQPFDLVLLVGVGQRSNSRRLVQPQIVVRIQKFLLSIEPHVDDVPKGLL